MRELYYCRLYIYAPFRALLVCLQWQQPRILVEKHITDNRSQFFEWSSLMLTFYRVVWKFGSLIFPMRDSHVLSLKGKCHLKGHVRVVKIRLVY